jgi:hypothetical protein
MNALGYTEFMNEVEELFTIALSPTTKFYRDVGANLMKKHPELC